MTSNGKKLAAGHGPVHVLVEEMVQKPMVAELIAKLRVDPVFRPVHCCRHGRHFYRVVERLCRFKTAIECADRSSPETIQRVSPTDRVWHLPPADIDALVHAIQVLESIGQQWGDELTEIEINPLAVFAEGENVMALDAVIVGKGRIEMNNVVSVVGIGETGMSKRSNKTSLSCGRMRHCRLWPMPAWTMDGIDGVIVAPSLADGFMMPSVSLCDYLNIYPKFTTAPSMGGAVGGTLVELAIFAINSGMCDNVLIVGGESRSSTIGRNNAVALLSNVSHPDYETPYGTLVPVFIP